MKKASFVERLVAFAVLMENGDGIVDKSPEYILEKYHQATRVPDPEQLLDPHNLVKFVKWMNRWRPRPADVEVGNIPHEEQCLS